MIDFATESALRTDSRHAAIFQRSHRHYLLRLCYINWRTGPASWLLFWKTNGTRPRFLKKYVAFWRWTSENKRLLFYMHNLSLTSDTGVSCEGQKKYKLSVRTPINKRNQFLSQLAVADVHFAKVCCLCVFVLLCCRLYRGKQTTTKPPCEILQHETHSSQTLTRWLLSRCLIL